MQSMKNKTQDIVFIALFAVMIAVCSWISIPTTIPFTMQTFAVYLTLNFLGGKKGTVSVCLPSVGIDRITGLCKFHLGHRDAYGNNRRLYDWLDLLRACNVAHRKTDWQKAVGTSCFDAGGFACLLHSGYGLVYSRICTKQWSGRLMDSTSMVCDSLCYSGFGETGAGSMAQSAIREDYNVVMRRQIYGISI